ncbi:hypothetical protein AALA22_03870 [Anaerovoracaceae bacterium 41-7]
MILERFLQANQEYYTSKITIFYFLITNQRRIMWFVAGQTAGTMIVVAVVGMMGIMGL